MEKYRTVPATIHADQVAGTVYSQSWTFTISNGSLQKYFSWSLQLVCRYRHRIWWDNSFSAFFPVPLSWTWDHSCGLP